MTDHLIVLPGGGYQRLSERNEGTAIVDWLTGLGVPASVFRYPVRTRHPAVSDAVRGEVRRVRAAGADRVGLVGFSAGGHAAGHAAAADDPSERVDLVVLGYPVVSMELDTHGGARRTLLGAEASPELRSETSVDRLIRPGSPPFFVWHTAEDDTVPVEHSYRLGLALSSAGVPHELHVFPYGRHGLGLATGQHGVAAWTELCAEWLRGLGWANASDEDA